MPRRHAGGAALLLIGTLAAPAAMAQVWSLYDDFSGSTLSPAKWAAEESQTFNAAAEETRRTLVAGQLRLEAKAFGDNMRSLGVSAAHSAMALVSRERRITGIKATVTMRGGSANACPSSPTAGSTAAGLSGSFFNAGTPQRGSAMNDVHAGIALQRASTAAPGSGYVAEAFVALCADADCRTTRQLLKYTAPGTYAVDTPVVLSVAWNPKGNLFKFGIGASTYNYTYTLNDLEPAEMPGKRVEVRNTMPQCAGLRVASITSADFDNVNVDGLSTLADEPQAGQ